MKRKLVSALEERRLNSGRVKLEFLVPVTYYLIGLNNSSGSRESRLGEAADFLTALFSRNSLKSKYRGLGRRWKS